MADRVAQITRKATKLWRSPPGCCERTERRGRDHLESDGLRTGIFSRLRDDLRACLGRCCCRGNPCTFLPRHGWGRGSTALSAAPLQKQIYRCRLARPTKSVRRQHSPLAVAYGADATHQDGQAAQTEGADEIGGRLGLSSEATGT
jgi:hypothetical protein